MLKIVLGVSQGKWVELEECFLVYKWLYWYSMALSTYPNIGLLIKCLNMNFPCTALIYLTKWEDVKYSNITKKNPILSRCICERKRSKLKEKRTTCEKHTNKRSRIIQILWMAHLKIIGMANERIVDEMRILKSNNI